LSILNLFNFSGMPALVTGGSSGLGRALAEALHEGGAEVAVAGVSERSQAVAAEIGRDGPRVIALRANLAQRAAARELFEEAIHALGQVDILVTPTGASSQPGGRLSGGGVGAGRRGESQFSVRLVPTGGARDAGVRGKIITVASLLSLSGGLTVPAYAASKGGVAQLTKVLASEWAGREVNVNGFARATSTPHSPLCSWPTRFAVVRFWSASLRGAGASPPT
jgi:2-deoxy-D-gluconate 3-dehydrogenase